MYESDEHLGNHPVFKLFSFSRTLSFSVRGGLSNKQNYSDCGRRKGASVQGPGLPGCSVSRQAEQVVESKVNMCEVCFMKCDSRVTRLVSVLRSFMTQILVIFMLTQTVK